jgi:hypothetical protein
MEDFYFVIFIVYVQVSFLYLIASLINVISLHLSYDDLLLLLLKQVNLLNFYLMVFMLAVANFGYFRYF